jgi:hypothetical protein
MFNLLAHRPAIDIFLPAHIVLRCNDLFLPPNFAGTEKQLVSHIKQAIRTYLKQARETI